MFSKIKGVVGETVLTLMLKSLPEEEYIVLNNVLLQTDRGTTQIDHIVLSLYGIFVIEMKNYQGWITGSDSSKKWSQNIYGKKSRFQNPIHQNYGHIKALETLLRLPEHYFIPMVVFSTKADLKVNTNHLVLYTTQVKSAIREFKKERLMQLEIERYKKTISQANITSFKARRTHEQDIKTKIQANKALIQQGICPKCKGRLVERKGKYGTFTGCSHFPTCRFTVK